MLYIVRQAESYFNRYGVEEPDPDLTYIGRRQATKLGEELKGIEFGSIFCSPLRGALQTLMCAKLLGGNFRVSDLLREKRESHCDFKPDEQHIIESEMEVQARCKIFFDVLRNSLPNEKILIITHSGFIKEFFKMLGLVPRLVENCEVIKIPWNVSTVFEHIDN